MQLEPNSAGSRPTIGRRRFLTGTTAVAVLAGIGATAGCGSSSGSAASGGSAAQLPTYKPSTAVRPDLAGTTSGVPEGFLRYPDNPVSAAEAPTGGGPVTALLSSFAVTPRPASNNPYLSELNRRCRHDLQLQVIAAADYPTKLATVIAGGQFPDLLEMVPAQAQLPKLLSATCADLSDLVGGDNVANYPNLAAYPTEMWRTTVFEKRIFGIPVPRPVQSAVPFVRTDLFERRGLSADPRSWEEFRELCQALTQPKGGSYALSMAPVAYLTGALGGCNEWQLEGETLLRYQETEQYRQALSWCADLYKAGLIHPDAFAPNATVLGKQRLIGGQVGVHPDGFSAWGSLARFLPDGEREVIGGLSVRGFSGATPTYQVTAGSVNFTVIKKADDARVRELLSVLNYLAAPFGSEEFFFRKYGTVGTQSTMSKGNPTLTDAGTDQVTPVTEAFDYHLVDAVKVAYEGDLTEITKRKHAFALAAEPHYVRNPVSGLYSDTYATRNAVFVKNVTDVQNGIITGRQQMSALDDVLAGWNRGDGKAIKAEFTEARASQ